MIFLSVEEFAAKRRGDQDTMEKDLYPHVSQAIEAYPVDGWYNDLLAEVARQYLTVFHNEGGTGQPKPSAAEFTADVRTTLDKTKDPTPATVDRLSTWLSTAILNAGTQAAADTDEEFLVMEWVTMHDDDVRRPHRLTEGQQRPIGEPFDVDGTPMRYPGDPLAPIELWINCRCTLAPLRADDTAFPATSEGIAMTDTSTETPPGRIDLAEATPWHGVLAPEGVWSGDGRRFAEGALQFRDLPIPLTWQKVTSGGHDGSVVIGRIDQIERVGNMMNGSGVFLATPEADEVVGLISEFGRFGVSIDADSAEMDLDDGDEDGRRTFTSARIASASVVTIPAFAEAYISLGGWGAPSDDAPVDVCDPDSPDYDPDACSKKKMAAERVAASTTFKRGPGWVTNPEETRRLHAYWTTKGQPGYIKIGWGTPGDFNRCRLEVGEEIAENSPEKTRFLNQICAQWHFDALGFWPGRPTSGEVVPFSGDPAPAVSLVASATSPVKAAWFANPRLDGPTPLTVTDEGRVYGHLATWGTCHIGFDGVCIEPPHSETDYAYFRTGVVHADNGERIPVGQVTMGGGHARPGLRWRAALAHYDSTSSVVADIACGDDEYGIWVAGQTRDLTDAQVRELRAAPLSGDWRAVRTDNLELIAALAVNTPGFPVPRVGIDGGTQVSLVASAPVVSNEETPAQVLDRLGFNPASFGDAVVEAMDRRERRKARLAALRARTGR